MVGRLRRRARHSGTDSGGGGDDDDNDDNDDGSCPAVQSVEGDTGADLERAGAAPVLRRWWWWWWWWRRWWFCCWVCDDVVSLSLVLVT
jgi:hypothetical protein